jgi:signal transduction histidine kinase
LKRVLEDMTRIVKLLARETVRRPTSLQELVEEVLLKHNYAIEEGGVKVEVADNLPTVNVDPEKLREALGALISNALFFNDRSKGERRIAIDYSATSNEHQLCVRDNGIGIEERYAPQIFELGGASKLDKSRGGGPGYGLYLAKRVMENHGGTLTFESTRGEGSRFCMTLPRE